MEERRGFCKFREGFKFPVPPTGVGGRGGSVSVWGLGGGTSRQKNLLFWLPHCRRAWPLTPASGGGGKASDVPDDGRSNQCSPCHSVLRVACIPAEFAPSGPPSVHPDCCGAELAGRRPASGCLLAPGKGVGLGALSRLPSLAGGGICEKSWPRVGGPSQGCGASGALARRGAASGGEQANAPHWAILPLGRPIPPWQPARLPSLLRPERLIVQALGRLGP